MQIKAGKENSMEDRYLFRAKRTDNEEWIEGLPSCDINGNLTEFEVYRGFANCEIADVDSETVCQWTGLTDENNRKIFEGDICKYYNSEDKDGIAVIREDYAEWRSGTIRQKEIMTPLFYLKCSKEWEVIGNIFDNPELLQRAGT